MKTLLTALAAFLLLQISLAQNIAPPVHFNHLSIKDGMPEGTVNSLLQDKQGYIWIGTGKGLVRYDGYTPKVYDFGIQDPYGMNIRKLFEDGKGELWAGGFPGLFKYDRANDRFIPFIEKYLVNDITEDRRGNLWLMGYDRSYKYEKLIYINRSTKKEVLFGIEEKGKHHINAESYAEFFKDKEQRIWVGSDNGLYEYNAKDSTFIPHFAVADSSKQTGIHHVQEDAAQGGILYFAIHNPYSGGSVGLGNYNSGTGSFTIFHHNAKDTNSIGSDTIWQVRNDSKGRLWVLTNAGFSLFHPATQTFTTYTNAAFKNSYRYGYTFQEDKRGNLWCNTDYGLFYLDVTTGRFVHYAADQKKNGLVDNTLRELMLDRAGILWFGVAEVGLQWMDTKHHNFIKYANDNTADRVFKGERVNSIAKAADGTMWLGTRHGLYHWLPLQDSFQLIKFAPNTDTNTRVIRVMYDSKGLIWLCAYPTTAYPGLYCYNPSTGKTIIYRHRENDTTSLSSDHVVYICEDYLGDIWVGTWGAGVCRFNRQSGTFTQFPFMADNHTSSDTQGALDNNYLGCIYEDQEGTLWVGTQGGGLNRFDRQRGTFTSYLRKLPGFVSVSTINEDSKGRLWIGTFMGGLFQLTKNRDSVKRFTEKDGLLYDGVIATAEDNMGNIWVTSQRGISILHPQTGQVRTITDIGEFNFNVSRTILKTNKSDFVIGTNDGIVVLNPDGYAPDTNAPQVHIEALHLTTLSNNKPTDSVIVAASRPAYQFRYNENRISFRYVGLYYPDAQKTQYAYKLDGYDKDWVPAGTQRTVTYTNLSPATYTFHVKAANSDGVWSKDKSITFTITPPWWETWWFRICSVIAMIVVVYFIVQQQSRNLKKQNIVLEEKVQDRTKELKQSLEELRSTQAQLIQQEKMASLGQLTAGIAHEIQNPLNFVNNFSEINTELIEELKEELEKGNDLEEVNAIINDIEENSQKIIHHGKRADSIVKGMLQHSRAGTGKKEPTNINALVDECLRLSYHGMRAKDKDFNATINTNFDDNIGKINIVPQDISRVLLNLLNNAFYAVDEKKSKLNGTYEPAVSVCTKKGDGKVEIKVQDNGSGIPQNIIDKIFQPFFTTKPTGKGTGLGLSLSYDIIKAHGGEITVAAKEGEGSEFVIALPYT